VLGQLAERHRLVVRLPVHPVIGHALEQFAGDRHFVIELGQERVDYRHVRRARPSGPAE
jgi:hypothetical protein